MRNNYFTHSAYTKDTVSLYVRIAIDRSTVEDKMQVSIQDLRTFPFQISSLPYISMAETKWLVLITIHRPPAECDAHDGQVVMVLLY